MTVKSLKSIGLIGAGRMGSALIQSWLKSGIFVPEEVLASDPLDANLDQLREQTGIRTSSSNSEVARNCPVILLAVKPANVRSVLREIQPDMGETRLLISIAAGIRIQDLENILPSGCRVVRVMPNTPCLVSAAAVAFSRGKYATAEDATRVASLFGAVGLAIELDERHLDAVTALSASGPAYVFLLIEALSDGGVKMGLPRDVATQLAVQTVLGSARMVMEMDQHPRVLRDQVTSPGGTTQAGLQVLEDRKFREALIEAVESAARRARELSQEQ